MLGGLKVIEIEGIGPGPFAAMMLADLGADVTVVHREDVPVEGMTDKSLLDRGKKSVLLNLKTVEGKASVRELVRTADIIIEGMRPGTMEKLGLGPDDLHAVNPALIYGRVTGWGQNGPRAKAAGHDLNYIALSGALWYASPPGQAPFTPPTLLGDIAGGALYLVAGVLSALYRVGRTGEGTVVDAAIVDGSAHMMNLIMYMSGIGVFSETRGKSILDGPHWSRCYQCSDGNWMSVQCLEPQFYKAFLIQLGLNSDPDFRQQRNPKLWKTLSGRLEEIFNKHPQQYWKTMFEQSDACVSPVLSPEHSQHEAHMDARGVWTTADGFLQAAPAPRFLDKTYSCAASKAIPKRGQHTDEILNALKVD